MLQLDMVDICILLVAASVSLSCVSGEMVLMQQKFNADEDAGNLTNCGDKSTNFLLNWSPRILKPGVTMTLDVSWTAVASFAHGDLCVTIWLQGVEEPIYKDCHDQDCDSAKKAIGRYLPIQCPLPQDFQVNFRKLTYTIEPTIPLPSGKFKLRVDLKNEDKKQLLCAEGNVEIIDE
jgi:hypothetical protein